MKKRRSDRGVLVYIYVFVFSPLSNTVDVGSD